MWPSLAGETFLPNAALLIRRPLVADVPEPTSEQNDCSPKISQFVLYAERSIRLGHYCHATEGDVGIRTALPRSDSPGAEQLIVGKHAKCCDVFSPSTSLEIYSEVHDVFTDQLHRVEDIGVGKEYKFPEHMPELPLAIASGRGKDITVERFGEFSLGPGTYGALTMLHESKLWLAAGTYMFSSIRMDEHSRLRALPGGVNVGVTGNLWTDRKAVIGMVGDEAKARHFMISVAGTDISADADRRITASAAVVIGDEAEVHALLAGPHGTVEIGRGVRIKGAIAGFDIVAHEEVHAEFQSGFPVSPQGQQGSQRLSGYFGVPAPSLAPLVGPVPQDTQIWLAIGLPTRDASGLNALIKQVSDPKSPNFRKFITQGEFNSTYGATDADYLSLKKWADSSGFTIVATYPNNLLLSVKASAAFVEQALFVNQIGASSVREFSPKM
jgi:hypothetical protein